MATRCPVFRVGASSRQPRAFLKDLNKRRATAATHDVDKAEDPGYVEFLDCFDSPAGGMGQHYVDLSALDDTVDPLHPEAMVDEVKSDSRLKPSPWSTSCPTQRGRTVSSAHRVCSGKTSI